MNRIAFKMKVNKGYEAEYKRRHNEIWPELKELLTTTGISNYSIFLDETTNELLGVMNVTDQDKFQSLPQQPVMQKWWAYMKDIMETNPDNSPVSISLKEVFYLT